MIMASGGMDVFYIDESVSDNLFVVTAVGIPLLRPTDDGRWRIVWEDFYQLYKDFRRDLRDTHKVAVRKELHASKLASGRGAYRTDKRRLGAQAGSKVYLWILSRLDSFLPPDSVITVTARPGSKLYGATRLEACLHALFQRMQRACTANRTNAFTFFDQGHGEYLAVYRRARHYLPTGSMLGGWMTGFSRNLPMTNFFKDGNFKDSKHSLFVQAADLIAYAAMLQEKGDLNSLTPWQQKAKLGDAYNQIPAQVLNLRASRRDPFGRVRL